MVKIKHPISPSYLSSRPPPGSPPEASSSVDLSKVRAYAACRNCRTKKVKCLPGTSQISTFDSNGNPSGPSSCQQCLTGGLECTYPPTRDRAAYSRQYVQNLEGRVQALEMIQNRMLPILEAYENSGNGSSSVSSGPRLPIPQLVHREEPSSPQVDPESDADERGAQMMQDERGNYRWIGSSNTLSLLNSFSRTRSPHEPTPPVSSSHDNPYFSAVAGSGVVKVLPGVDEVSYPTPTNAREMVDAFFREVYPILPVLEEQSFRDEYNALMERRAKGDPQGPGGFIAVVFAVFALGERVLIASRAWQREKTRLKEGKATEETVLPGEAEAGVIWYERAQILHYTTLEDVNLHQVQCLTLMAAFQASVNAMPMSWLLAGQAVRVAQDLGLHRSTARLNLSFGQKQLRARCWWALYGLERLVSVTLGRPLGVDDLDIDVALPAAVDDSALTSAAKSHLGTPDVGEEAATSTISGFIALTKLCKIAGRVAQLLYRPSQRFVSDPSWSAQRQDTINKLDKLLKDWLENDVPAKYKDHSSTARPVQLVSAVLSNAYFAVLLALHRNFLPSNPHYPRPRPPSNSQSLSHLVEAARSVIHVAAQQRVLLPPSHHLATTCSSLWSSAIILLLCEVQAKDQIVIDAVGSSVESCRQTLQTLEPAWPGARKLKELLNDVEMKMKAGAVNGVQNGPNRSKKRKSANAESAPTTKRSTPSSSSMLPPTNTSSPRQASWNAQYPMGLGTTAQPRAYETSDTRTRREESIPFNTQTTQAYTSSHSSNITPPSQHSAAFTNGIDTSQLFDIGGVTFEGLELLQGFDFGTDTANYWDSFVSPTAAANYTMSGNNTPNSGLAGGPSPSSWGIPTTGIQGHLGQGQIGQTDGTMNQQQQQQVSMAGMSATGGIATDFWSQVAPGGYDWGADPNVPFNI